jgi:hypothetical protein
VNLWVLWPVLGALALAIGYLALRGARSPLRPLLIAPTAWRHALDCWRTNRRVLLAITLLVVLGAALQAYFVNASGYDAGALQIASIVWQALVAASTAALAVPLHLFIIRAYLGAAAVSLQTRSLRPLVIRAAAYGLAIWTFDYLMGVAAKVVVQWADPSLLRLEYFGLIFVSFLATSLLALVRPSLSLGLPRPFRAGTAMASGNVLALYLVLAVMALPQILLGPEAAYVPSLLIKSQLPAHLVSVALISALDIFQYLAVEIATVLFALGALRRAGDEARQGTRETETAQLPLSAAP